MTQPDPVFHCNQCGDEPNGWRLFWCAGIPVAASSHPDQRRMTVYHCGRAQPHLSHSYAERCGCLGTNPVIAAAQERQRKYVTTVAEKRASKAAR